MNCLKLYPISDPEVDIEYSLMKVLILSSLRPETGNSSTARRIRQEVLESDTECELADMNQFGSSASLNQYLKELDIQCAIGIHAWRSGCLLWDCCVPYSIVFGGTDINEHYHDEYRMKVMTKALANAKYLIAFSKAMMEQAVKLWPSCKDKIRVQSQAVLVNPSKTCLKSLIYKQIVSDSEINISNSIQQETLIFLLVAGLRQVKDPLFLTETVSEWHSQDKRIHLAIIGPELDEQFVAEVKTKVQSLPGVELMPALPNSDLHALIKNSFAVVNSSKSEGMATTLIEAMALDVPVLARNIPGNAAIIEHGETGLLFRSPQEFVSLAKQLIQSESLLKDITKNAKEYVQTNHSYETEKKTYVSLIKEMHELENMKL